MFMVGVVEDGIVSHGVLFRGKGVIVFFGAIKFKDKVFASFSAILDCHYIARADDISLTSIPLVLRNRHWEPH